MKKNLKEFDVFCGGIKPIILPEKPADKKEQVQKEKDKPDL